MVVKVPEIWPDIVMSVETATIEITAIISAYSTRVWPALTLRRRERAAFGERLFLVMDIEGYLPPLSEDCGTNLR